MRNETLANFEHFVGKVCSIVTTSINRQFSEPIAREHYVVRVRKISQDGIWGVHPYNEELTSFFFIAHMVSIHEEIEIDPANPEHAEMIKEFEDKSGKTIGSDLKSFQTKKASTQSLPMSEEVFKTPEQKGDVTFVDIENLEQLAEISKRTFAAQSLLGRK